MQIDRTSGILKFRPSANHAGRAVACAVTAAMLLTGCDGYPRESPHDDYQPREAGTAVTTADMNADGMQDIVLGYTVNGLEGYYAGTGALILQNATVPGTFGRSLDLAAPTSADNPWSITTGDLDGSGGPDVAIGMGANKIRLFFQGAGAVTTRTDISYIGVPFGLVATDLNGDGRTDLAVTGGNNGGQEGIVLILQSATQNGVFLPDRPLLPAGRLPYALVSSDVNGDGRTDLISAGVESGANVVSVYLQSPVAAGTFSPRSTYIGGSQSFSLAIADLNNDDRPDIAVADSGANPAGVQVLFQDSVQPGIFRQPLVLTSRSTREIAAADVNGDNRTDLVLNLGRSVSVLQQEPTQAGVFMLTDSQALDCDGNQMALDDLNADDSLDIVLACGERAAVLFNSRSQPGRFTSPQKVGR